MVDAARGAGVRRFIHISSLAAREPELSDYGWSKARSERVVAASGLDWTILRPPAIYGPGDRETFELFKMARRGLVALPPKGRFSVIHVEDLCPADPRPASPRRTPLGETYEPDDGTAEGWDHRHFARTLSRMFGKRAATIAMPKAVMQGAARVDRLVRRAQGQADARPGPLFLPSRLGGHRRSAARPQRSGPPRSAPPPASRRRRSGIRSRAGCARTQMKRSATKATQLATSPARKIR